MIAKNLRIFITGKPGTGKTTLVVKLKSLLDEKDVIVTGFYTEETRGRKGRTGFKLTTIPENETYTLSSIKPPGIPFGKYYVKTVGIDKGIKALKIKAKIYIIDEVGPMEMKHPDFIHIIKEILKSNENIIAVIHRNLTSLVENENLYEITVENREELFEELKEIINKHFNGEKNE
jgi:nucleoside-triphosphatase